MSTYTFIMIVVLAFAIFANIALLLKMKKDSSDFTSETNKIRSKYFAMIDDVTKKSEAFMKRKEELERALEEGYGITAKIEQTVVKSEFSKLEMVIMYSGTMALIKNCSNLDDIRIYVKLAEKLQKYMDGMQEEEIQNG